MGVNIWQRSDEDEPLIELTDFSVKDMRVVCSYGGSLGLYQVFTQPAETLQAQLDRNARFGREVLLEWNLDDSEGKPIPATSEGMNAIPPAIAAEITRQYFDKRFDLTDVPLESNDGVTSTSRK